MRGRGVGLFLQPCSILGSEGVYAQPRKRKHCVPEGAGRPCVAELQKSRGSASVAVAG